MVVYGTDRVILLYYYLYCDLSDVKIMAGVCRRSVVLMLKNLCRCYGETTGSFHKGCARSSYARNFSVIAKNKPTELFSLPTSHLRNYEFNRHFSFDHFAAAIACSKPVIFSQELLQYVHDMSGMPWWATIALTTVVLRNSVTFPLSVYQTYILGKYTGLNPQMNQMAERLNLEVNVARRKFQWTERQAKDKFSQNMKRLHTEMIIKENCHPAKAFLLLWVQVPMWVCLSFSIRNNCCMMPVWNENAVKVFSQLSIEGALWFPSLISPDSTFIIPIAFGLVNLSIIEIHKLRQTRDTKLTRALTYFFRGLTLVLVPLACCVPTAMSLYWTVSSCCGLAQNLIMISPRFRKTFGIPLSPNDSAHPYKDLLAAARGKYFKYN